MRINYKLLRRCQELFRAKPSKSYMDSFFEMKDCYRDSFECGDEIPMCKTHLCIGGSALLLSGNYKLKSIGSGFMTVVNAKTGRDVNNQWLVAKRVLGLSARQASILFSESRWPIRFQSDSNKTGSRALAANMVARIGHFMKTKGKE